MVRRASHEHPGVHTAIEQDGRPALDLVRGQIVVVLNVDDDHAEDSTARLLATQAAGIHMLKDSPA